jgi:hypothetical protein
LQLLANINNLQNVNCYGEQTGMIQTSTIGGTPPYSYTWSDGSSAENIENIGAGSYDLIVNDLNSCQDTIYATIAQPDFPIEISNYFVTNTSDFGISDGSISLTVSGGILPYTFSWNNGFTTQNISNLAAGNYSTIVEDSNGCQISMSFDISVSSSNAPNWTYSTTPNPHLVLVYDNIPITINGAQIETGDYIGMFFDSLGTLACSGYGVWQGNNTTISAYGENLGNDGFSIGEEFNWKIWDASTGTEYIAVATYMPFPPMPNQGNFVNGGLSGLTSLIAEGEQFQEIDLPVGWSYFSTYMIPQNPSIDTVLNDVIQNVQIVKNYLGGTFWPLYNINLIGDISNCEGYQIKMINSDTLTIGGVAIIPENTSCIIPAGWSYLSYLRNNPASIIQMLSSISNDIEIVKDYLGGTYWPAWGINLIGDMKPGDGYQVKMNNSANLTYPAN